MEAEPAAPATDRDFPRSRLSETPRGKSTAVRTLHRTVVEAQRQDSYGSGRMSRSQPWFSGEKYGSGAIASKRERDAISMRPASRMCGSLFSTPGGVLYKGPHT
jgi:hypothetical protein